MGRRRLPVLWLGLILGAAMVGCAVPSPHGPGPEAGKEN